MQGDRPRRRIDSLDAAHGLFGKLLAGKRRERLIVAHLDGEQYLLGLQLRFGATEPQIAFPLRAIIGEALRLSSASLILAHNHPSGDPTPTASDLAATRDLVQAAGPLGIRIMDHLIFAGDQVHSFRQAGLL